MIKRIEIHCTDAKGQKFIMNRLTGENTGLSRSVSKLVDKDYRERLIEQAKHMAYVWSKVYPDDKFTVVEV